MSPRISLSVCLLVGLCTPAHPATMSLVAVAINGVPIQPTDTVAVSPGDAVSVELRLRDWGAAIPGGQLRVFDSRINGIDAASSGSIGSVLPLGWEAPLFPEPCDEGCPAEYPLCFTRCAQCVGSGHNPELGVVVDCSDPRHLLYGVEAICDVGLGEHCDQWSHFGVAIDGGVADPGNGYEALLGCLHLQVSADACGSFLFRFEPFPFTYIAGLDGNPLPVVRAPLIISTLSQPDDCNANSLPDQCDLQAGTSPDLNGSFLPDECELDFDGDGDLDLRDAAMMVNCFGTATDFCMSTDFYPDGQIDKHDWSAMSHLLSTQVAGPNFDP